MSEREISSSKLEKDPTMAADEPRAVFVDTNLNTHIIVPVYSHSSVTSLKRRLRREHFECYPELGRIEINALSVKVYDNYYHLPDYMLLKTAFHGVAKTWFVFADVWIPSSALESQKDIVIKPLEPHPKHHNEIQRVESPPQHHNESQHMESSPLPHVTLDMSSKKKKKKKKKRNGEEENVETKSDVKKQLNEKTSDWCQWDVPRTDKVSVTEHLDEPLEGHHDTSVVNPSVIILKDGGENIVKDLEEGAESAHQLKGTSTNLAEGLNKGCEIDNSTPLLQVKKTKKKKKDNIGVNQGPPASSDQEPDILEKGDAPSNNKHTIYQKGIKIAGEGSPVNRVAERVLPLLPQEELLNLDDREKEIYEDVAPVKSENTAKKRKTNKAKSSVSENQELCSKRQVDQKADDSRHIHGEHSLSDNTRRPEECVETISEIPKKKSRKRKDVPGIDPPRSPVMAMKEQPVEKIQEIDMPMTVIQSDKPKKRSQNKQSAPAVNLTSLSVNQHIDETMEMDTPKKVDDILIKRDTNGALLKLDNTAEKRKTNASEREQRTAEMLSQSHLNNVQELSQEETLNLIEREKEIDDVASLKSEHTVKKKKNRRDSQKKREANNVLSVNHGLSSKRQNDDLIVDDSKLIHGELSLQDGIDKPEESVETMSGSLKKRSLNREAVSGRVPRGSPLKEHPDEETRERAVPKTVIESDKPVKRSEKKQPVPWKHLSSVPGNKQSDEKMMEMDAPKSVEEANDILISHTDGAKNLKKVIQGEGHGDALSEIPSLEVSTGLSDLRHLEKSRSSKKKAKKLDQLTAVDTSSDGQNLVESKNNRGRGKTSELHSFGSEQGHNISIPPQTDILVSIADPIKTNKKAGISCASVDDGSRISGKKIMAEKDTPRRVEQADDLFTDAESNDAHDHKEVEQGKEHHGEFSQVPHPEVSAVLAEARQLEKPRDSKQKAKKLDQPSSIDTSSNGRNLLGSIKNKGSAKPSDLQRSITDQKPDKSISPLSAKHSNISKEVNSTLADPTNISRKTGVSRASVEDGSKSFEVLSMRFGSTVKKIRQGVKSKESPKKLEMNSVGPKKSSHLSTKETKKGLLASSRAIFDDGTSSSSDDEDRTDSLSSSTTLPPDNLSSSDYSEGESEAVVISQPDSSNGNGRSKANLSGSKLESILRSSNRYKKTKLVALQSQDESQPPEFVPDSLPDM